MTQTLVVTLAVFSFNTSWLAGVLGRNDSSHCLLETKSKSFTIPAHRPELLAPPAETICSD